VADLLQFHRRAQKPEWWAHFDRQTKSTEELIDDVECLGGLEETSTPILEKRSYVFAYRFPPQETKLQAGDDCLEASTLKRVGKIVRLDPDLRKVSIKRSANAGRLPELLSIAPSSPLDDRVMRGAIRRFAEEIANGRDTFAAVESILSRSLPKLAERLDGEPVVPEGPLNVGAAINAIRRLDHSHLVIQGPPGTGKTYLAARLIVSLLKASRRVGIASNSHKAINNLLREVEVAAKDEDFRFSGAKKSTADSPETQFNGRFVKDVFDNAKVLAEHRLVAGTAWLFADRRFQSAFDYLFIDEAGQVSLANVVAMGTAAKNIVLIGDQMQLGQPIQGVHPGESGLSVLDYLQQGAATISPDRGIFLDVSHRMHPDICRFLSEAVYDSRLTSHPSCGHQGLVLSGSIHPALKATGISFVEVSHQDCSQQSDEEAHVISQIFSNLLTQKRLCKDGEERPISAADVLVISPYNMQVKRLESALPADARVGTVDKFQGQESDVVLISMATSSAEHMPRDIEFLFSRNRLNVAISRARCLSIVVASPGLLEMPCTLVGQMALVNTLCHARLYATQK
jgi:uncharacterized protein